MKYIRENSARINNIEIDESWDVADADDFYFRSRQTKEDVFIPKRKSSNSNTIGIRDIGAWDIDVGSRHMHYRPQPTTKQHLREKTAFFHKDFKK